MSKKVGEKFCDALYQVMAFSYRKILDEDFKFNKTEFYSYSEVFEHFELVMLKLQPFCELMKYYDELTGELVGFAITKDVDDFDTNWIDTETLIKLRDKIDNQIEENKKLFGDQDEK